MQITNSEINQNIKKNIIDTIGSRKNLMIYDTDIEGSLDLDKNIYLRVFYSSPYDPFEFISIDFYKKLLADASGKRKPDIYGVMSVIRDNINSELEKIETIYGCISYEIKKVRDVDKTIIRLQFNAGGINNLSDMIKYFENNFCKK